MPEQTYPEECRYERNGQSIGVFIDDVFRDVDADETGHVSYTPCANVIINTDAQRPFTQDERDEWESELYDDIKERLRD